MMKTSTETWANRKVHIMYMHYYVGDAMFDQAYQQGGFITT